MEQTKTRPNKAGQSATMADKKMDFSEGLQKHLWKCELEYRAKMLPEGSCVDWLAPECDTTQSIADFLRSLGFKIKKIVDEEACAGEWHRWVITTSGIIVYANQGRLRGLVALSYGNKKKK